MDLFVLVFLMIALHNCKYVGENIAYLDVDTGKVFRGLFACSVFLHHVSQVTVGGNILRAFSNTGFLSVAFFFFLSGFGLQ